MKYSNYQSRVPLHDIFRESYAFNGPFGSGVSIPSIVGPITAIQWTVNKSNSINISMISSDSSATLTLWYKTEQFPNAVFDRTGNTWSFTWTPRNLNRFNLTWGLLVVYDGISSSLYGSSVHTPDVSIWTVIQCFWFSLSLFWTYSSLLISNVFQKMSQKLKFSFQFGLSIQSVCSLRLLHSA